MVVSACICFFNSSIAIASTVIGIRTANEIILGADSKAAGSDAMACKIIEAGDIYFAFSGRPSINIVVTTISHIPIKEKAFDAAELAVKVGKAGGSIASRVALFDSAIKANLFPILQFIWENQRDHFCKTFLVGDQIVLTAIIAGIENNIPVLYKRSYHIANNCETPVALKVDPVNRIDKMEAGRVDLSLLGEYKKILEFMRQKDITKDFDSVKSIQEWITLEANDKPDIVGLPIDVLRITPSKVEWIQHKPKCPEIRNDFER